MHNTNIEKNIEKSFRKIKKISLFTNIINFRPVLKTDDFDNVKISSDMSDENRFSEYSAQIYRSGSWQNVKREIAENIFAMLKITSHIDLRSNEEIKKHGRASGANGEFIEWKNFPLNDYSLEFKNKIFPNHVDYCEYYKSILCNNQEEIFKIITYIAHSSHTVFLISCYAGKDRTGIIVMLLLYIIGIDDETIMQDYEFSGQMLAENIDFFRPNWEKRGLTKEEYCIRLKPDRRILYLLMTYLVQNYGSIGNFLKSIGIKDDDMRKIRAKFVSIQRYVFRRRERVSLKYFEMKKL